MSVKNESDTAEVKTEDEEKDKGDLTEEQLEQVSGGITSNVQQKLADSAKSTINNFR